ncbi:hypothetical protein [Nocardia abscessus]|uniref:hypothetical protein n=1 Tax=Nocardia abscessus TaxID=120957 RepID=UPI002457CFB8|nr:hypothetical protein [Nocardia abscessus]
MTDDGVRAPATVLLSDCTAAVFRAGDATIAMVACPRCALTAPVADDVIAAHHGTDGACPAAGVRVFDDRVKPIAVKQRYVDHGAAARAAKVGR